MIRRALPFLLIGALTACGKDSTGPGTRDVQASALAGDIQFGLPGAELAEPLQVMVIDAVTERPVKDVTVTWRAVQGGATVLSSAGTTDARGIASTRVRLGAQVGTYAIEASAEGQAGESPRFQAFAVNRPVLTAVAPATAIAGDTVVLTGQNFHPQADYNAVLFDGIRGRTVRATADRVVVEVPACVPSRTVGVQLWVGAVSSGTIPVAAVGTGGAPLSLEVGQVRVFADPAELGCLRLPGGVAGARYVLIAQNVATTYSAAMPFVLATFAGAAPVAAPAPARSAAPTAELFELELRRRERAWVADAAELRRSLEGVERQAVDPVVGDRRSFKVLNRDNESIGITAEVKAVSQRAILYQDIEAPTGGFTTDDFTRFGQLFDDPIYATDVGVFGSPSDIDANGRIIILFTPRVNALTARGDGSVIAGYFYGCDLVAKSRCANTNSGEIFYSLVPDPQAKYSDARTTAAVLRTVVPVLAHEFQHMINFANRNSTLDALWLSEGLAHTAEDVVGQVFEQRGDFATAKDFLRPNYSRAARFLALLSDHSMIANEEPGTLELRGGAWLMLRYLRAHYGGNDLLRRLTQTGLSSTANVVSATGQGWARLLGDFAVALYTATDLQLDPLEPRHTFGSMAVRTSMINEGYGYPLQLNTLSAGDGSAADALPSSSSSIFVLSAPAGATNAPINVVFAGTRGGPYSGVGEPQLVLLRAK